MASRCQEGARVRYGQKACANSSAASELFACLSCEATGKQLETFNLPSP